MAAMHRTGSYNFHAYVSEEPISNDVPIKRLKSGYYSKLNSKIKDEFVVPIFRRSKNE